MLQKLRELVDSINRHKYKILAGISIGAALYYLHLYLNDDNRIRLSSFLQAIKKNQLSEVVVKGNEVAFRSNLSDWYYSSIAGFPRSDLFTMLKSCNNLAFSIEETMDQTTLTAMMLAPLLGATLYMIYKQSDVVKGFTEKIHNPQNLNSFNEFFGGESIKNKFNQIIDYIRSPQKYERMGARVRRGVLLYGPPGTGKTMLARALAREAGIGFIGVCASQFEEIFVGVGPKRIREMFQKARLHKQGCIIFIDELDAIGARKQGLSATRQTSLTINQLLTEMDGFDRNKNIIVVGATNRIDLIDSAILRSGRFDLKFKIQLPDEVEREGILRTLLQTKKIPHNIQVHTLRKVCQMSDSWSGADLECLLNESIFSAIKRGDNKVIDDDIESCSKAMVTSKNF